MQVFKNTHDLRSIELGLLEVEMLYRAMVGEEVTSSEQLCDEIDIAVVLKEAIVVHLETM